MAKVQNSNRNSKIRGRNTGEKSRHDRKGKMKGHDAKTVANHGGIGNEHCSYDAVTSNDIAWYDKAQFLFQEATRVPFDAIAGAPREYGSLDPRRLSAEGYAGDNTFLSGVAVPGVMVVEFVPTIGWSDSVNSPLNRAFTTLYGDIASKTTGAMQFQQADLAMLVTSLSSISTIIGQLKRLLEVATLYSPLNYYYPVDLLTALTGTQSEAMKIIQNRDLYRAQVNDLVFQFNSMRIPHFVEIYKRQYALSHNVYADEDSVQAQLFVFRPTGYYTYHDTAAELRWTELTSFTFENLVAAAQSALNAWRNSSDLPLITGALIRAYPDNQFITLDMLSVDSRMIPVYDRNILWQINNSRTAYVNAASLAITQDVANNILISQPCVFLDSEFKKHTAEHSWVYLNSYDHNETPEFIMEATRLIPTLDPEYMGEDSSGNWIMGLKDCCTEIVTKYRVYHRVRKEDGTLELLDNAFTSVRYYTTADNAKGIIHGLSVLSKWRNGPRFDVYRGSVPDSSKPDEQEFVFLGTFGDLADYTYLYPNQLRSLNQAALQSLFWVESMTLKV